jgi:IS5 family transposase
MRQERTTQASLFDGFAGHETGQELKAMSEWLDGHRELGDERSVPAPGDKRRTARLARGIGSALRAPQAASSALAFHLEDCRFS